VTQKTRVKIQWIIQGDNQLIKLKFA